MCDYYSEKLSAERLKRCYEIAPPRVQQYLQAEVDYVLGQVKPGSTVLELGCGYGRVLGSLAGVAGTTIGIDTSLSSLDMAGRAVADRSRYFLACMNAAQLGFHNELFDVVVCIQNGISAFHVDQRQLIVEGLRVTRSGGLALFSTYSDRFWDDRLEWFEIQAKAGLLGEIDHEKTGDGRIVCKDGFTGTAVGRDRFQKLTSELSVDMELVEIDHSSLFCILKKKASNLNTLS